uniref:Biotin carboxylation domain-containing protein n=1 Tax=Timema douglasi TaxID=61478 RepID=A0A7R8Z7P3_TIMDO|nr:unnamed protein product [Timema douglasi]
MASLVLTSDSQHLGIYTSPMASLVLTSDSQHLGIYTSPMASLVLTSDSQHLGIYTSPMASLVLTSDIQHLGIYTSPMASLVLTTDSQHLGIYTSPMASLVLTSDSQHLGIYSSPMTSLGLTSDSQHLGIYSSPMTYLVLTSDSQHLGIYSSPMASLVLTDSSQLTSDTQHLGIYSSPRISLVLTDSSQLTSDSQHLGIYSIPMASLVLTDSSQLTSDTQHLDPTVGAFLSSEKPSDKTRMETGNNTDIILDHSDGNSNPLKKPVNFILGDGDGDGDDDQDGQIGFSEEASDLFPSDQPDSLSSLGREGGSRPGSSTNLNNMFALTERRKRLRFVSFHSTLFRPSMSQGTVMAHSRFQEKDFTVGTPEEFVRRFGGSKVINKATNAEYLKMADHYVPVPGGSNNNNYANVELILDIAVRTQAQAVWAGWGHASENPKLPELLHKSHIAFIGPPDRAMWALGDKIASSIVAQTANIPTLPWSGSGECLNFS